jgi:hypothetical protein
MKHFHFRSFWTKLSGYLDAVKSAWHPLQRASPFCRLDWLLRNMAHVLQSWSTRFVGSIRMQLAITKEVVLCLESAYDRRQLAMHEEELRRALKLKALRLASLQRTVARQESRILWLREGEAPTKFFHVYMSARGRKKRIRQLVHDDQTLGSEEGKAEAAYSFANLLGMAATRTNTIDLDTIGMPSQDLGHLCQRFTEDEVWSVIRSLNPDKAPDPGGFTTRFLQSTWQVIRCDVMLAFEAFWHLDSRNLHSINEALLTLLPKKDNAETLKDYCLIFLIHMMGKLLSKVLANQMAPHLDTLIHHGQSAIIKGHCIQDNFRFVHSSTRMIHTRNLLWLMLKVDIARAFDSGVALPP